MRVVVSEGSRKWEVDKSVSRKSVSRKSISRKSVSTLSFKF